MAADTDEREVAEERRLVTVLSVDLVGFTALADERDPEDIRAFQARFFVGMRPAIAEFGGTIEKYIGDEILVLFGAPRAREDDAERAVRCALAMRAAFASVAERAARGWHADVNLRVGVNTGEVVSGTWDAGDRRDYAVSGDVVNTAARIQKAAAPGEILVGEHTMRLARRAIRFGERRELTLKGKASPVPAYPVLGAHPQPAQRWEHRMRLTPLVGRAHELATLRGYLTEARRGRGRAVFVSGEAGVGKSRLLLELRRSLMAAADTAGRGAASEDIDGDVTWLEAHCWSSRTMIPYLPIVELLKRAFGIEEDDDGARVIARVESAAALWPEAARATVPYLRFLLSVDPGDPTVLAMAPRDRRAGVLDGLRALLLHESQRHPLVVVIEDLHWIDEQSEESLGAVMDILAGMPLLLILTYRPGYDATLGERGDSTRLALEELPAEQSAALASAVLGDGELPAPVRPLILAKAEGNPFFIEEVTHCLLETGMLSQREGTYVLERPVERMHIPNTIQEIILSRLDRLERPTKQTMQLAAVIGREFARRLLERVAQPRGRLEETLHELKHRELIYEKSYFPELAYLFKHALTHDMAYSTVVRERRKTLHRMVGAAIEEVYADRLAEQVELLAWHYAEGEDWPKAVSYLLDAGDKAMAAYANSEALDYYARALELSERLGAASLPTALRAAERRTLANLAVYRLADAVADANRVLAIARQAGDRVYEARALALVGFCGVWSLDYKRAEACLREARALAQEVDDDRAAFLAELMLADLYALVGRHDDARAILPRLERLVPASYGPVIAGETSAITAIARVWRSEFAGAIEWMDRWRAHEGSGKVVLGATYLETLDFARLLALAGRGEYSHAITVAEQIIARCERAGEQMIYARTLNTLGWICGELGDYGRAVELNRRSAELGRQLPNVEVVSNAVLNLADCLAAQGRLDEAEAHYREIERVVRSPAAQPMEAECWLVWRYAQHLFHSDGELWLARGDAKQALANADECLALAEASVTRKNVVKGRRLRGQALMALGELAAAETDLNAALAMAREVGNPPQLWRTLAALGDLRQARGKPAQARQAYREAIEVVEHVAARLIDGELRQTFLDSSETKRIRQGAGTPPRTRRRASTRAGRSGEPDAR
jgi:class 3 adenylate cyclase/tetratricopeptide (TPR) repeat protein